MDWALGTATKRELLSDQDQICRSDSIEMVLETRLGLLLPQNLPENGGVDSLSSFRPPHVVPSTILYWKSARAVSYP